MTRANASTMISAPFWLCRYLSPATSLSQLPSPGGLRCKELDLVSMYVRTNPTYDRDLLADDPPIEPQVEPEFDGSERCDVGPRRTAETFRVRVRETLDVLPVVPEELPQRTVVRERAAARIVWRVPSERLAILADDETRLNKLRLEIVKIDQVHIPPPTVTIP